MCGVDPPQPPGGIWPILQCNIRWPDGPFMATAHLLIPNYDARNFGGVRDVVGAPVSIWWQQPSVAGNHDAPLWHRHRPLPQNLQRCLNIRNIGIDRAKEFRQGRQDLFTKVFVAKAIPPHLRRLLCVHEVQLQVCWSKTFRGHNVANVVVKLTMDGDVPLKGVLPLLLLLLPTCPGRSHLPVVEAQRCHRKGIVPPANFFNESRPMKQLPQDSWSHNGGEHHRAIMAAKGAPFPLEEERSAMVTCVVHAVFQVAQVSGGKAVANFIEICHIHIVRGTPSRHPLPGCWLTTNHAWWRIQHHRAQTTAASVTRTSPPCQGFLSETVQMECCPHSCIRSCPHSCCW